MPITTAQRNELVRRACDIRLAAYAPYSHFLVGASLLTERGDFFDGANVENASFGLTNCAERTAVFSAIAAGERNFVAMAIASRGRFAPCGACRQVIAEFSPALPIYLVDPQHPSDVASSTMTELLPGCFRLPKEADRG